MSSDGRKSGLSSRSGVDKIEYTDSEWKTSLDDDADLDEYPAQETTSAISRLLHRIPYIGSGRRGDECAGYVYHYHAAATEDGLESPMEVKPIVRIRRSQPSKWLKWLKRMALTLPMIILCLFGALHILLVLFGKKNLFWDIDEYGQYLPNWGSIADIGETCSSYPTDFTRDVQPIPCNSHNDYERRRPLFDALRWGCTSVEADVWWFEGEEELFIGHHTASLRRDRTFRSLYVDPIVEILERMNPISELNSDRDHGIFDVNPAQTLVLLVDFKTDGYELFPRVRQQLDSLRQRNYLSYWNGENFVSRAVTVVATGNAPFDLIVENKEYRDIFFDAPLDDMYDGSEPRTGKRSPSPAQGQTGIDRVTSPDDFNATNSYFASVSFTATIGYPWRGRLTEDQMDLIRGQIRGAKRRGLKARYWETPNWPTSLRNYVWDVLVKENADILNVDDLKSAAALDWNAPIRHSWFDA